MCIDVTGVDYLGYKPPAALAPQDTDQAMHELMATMPVNNSAPKLDNSAWETFAKESHDHG